RCDKALLDELYTDTGCMVHAIYPLYKLIHLREQNLDLRNSRVSEQASFIFWRLTGKRWTTTCMASGSGFFNSRKKDYNKRSLELAGITKDQLGELHEPTETAPLNEEFASLLGVKSGIPVVPPCADGAFNQIGSLAGDNDMTLSVGTSAALRLNIPSADLVNERKTTWRYLSPHSWMIGAATSGATNCVDWFRQNLALNSVSYDELAYMSDESIAKADVPFFMPFLFGERCPGWNDDKKAVFYQLRPEHTLFDMYRSVLEGVLFNTYQCYQEICRATRIPERILISGGILKSPVWLKMAANIFGRPLYCDITDQASMLGGAYLTEEILTGNRVVSDQRRQMVEPDETSTAYYKERYERYLEYYIHGEENDGNL
ncbi:MAG: FGGY-family carbohydrate kinase, partial [Clostridiales bacterium]|nr:FGGY-family carbohydrate kinase [Clostridiales bacterium]